MISTMIRSRHIIISLLVALTLAGCAAGGGKTSADGFDTAIHEADSVYNSMEFNKAYGLYLQMLDLPELRQDDAKRLEVYYSLCCASEMASQQNDQMKWLSRLLDLARDARNDYYLSQGLMMMGKHLYYEGDRSQGIAYIREAIDLAGRTDRRDADHIMHSQLNVLSSILSGMRDFDAAVETDRRNVKLTYEGVRWGSNPQIQLRDRRTALAKLAAHCVMAGQPESADSVWMEWKAVPIEEGRNPRDYFIVDYLRERGRYTEAERIYEGLIAKIRTQSDTLSNMMLFAKSGLAEVEHKTGKYRRASDLYVEVLEISDTLQARLARRNAQELSVLYETREKERQLHVREMWIVILCGGAAVLLSVIAAMLRNSRKMRRKNRFMAQALDELADRQDLAGLTAGKAPDSDSAITPVCPAPPQEKRDDGSAALFADLDRRIDSEQLYLNPDLSRDDLCRLSGIDKNALGGLLKQYGGAANLQVYINRKRIRYAVLMLRRHPEWTMLSIAQACGMTNTATFNRIFRQTYGMTPTEYVKSKRGEVSK